MPIEEWPVQFEIGAEGDTITNVMTECVLDGPEQEAVLIAEED